MGLPQLLLRARPPTAASQGGLLSVHTATPAIVAALSADHRSSDATVEGGPSLGELTWPVRCGVEMAVLWKLALVLGYKPWPSPSELLPACSGDGWDVDWVLLLWQTVADCACLTGAFLSLHCIAPAGLHTGLRAWGVGAGTTLWCAQG